jgi:hypothetical protein
VFLPDSFDYLRRSCPHAEARHTRDSL